MRGAAFNTIGVLLAVYVAALVWGLQHLSDRYSPKLLKLFLRRMALCPITVLALLLCVSGFLLLPSVPHFFISLFTQNRLQAPIWAGDVLAAVWLAIAYIFTIYTVYRLVQTLAGGACIISWLQKTNDQFACLEDILLNAVQRKDVQLTYQALHAFLSILGTDRPPIIDVLEDHHVLLETNWLTRELIKAILSALSDTEMLYKYDDLLCAILDQALNQEDFAHARFVLETLCGTLKKAQIWNETHMNLLCHIGFTLWKIGEYTASATRTAKIPEQLRDLQWLLYRQTRQILRHIIHLSDADAVDAFTRAFCRLIEEAATTQDLYESFLSRVYDILDDGYHNQVLKAETLHELISSLGHLRNQEPAEESKDIQEQIDTYILASLAILAKLGEKEGDLYRAASNAYISGRIIGGNRLRVCWSPITQQVERVKRESIRWIAESLINASELAGRPS